MCVTSCHTRAWASLVASHTTPWQVAGWHATVECSRGTSEFSAAAWTARAKAPEAAVGCAGAGGRARVWGHGGRGGCQAGQQVKAGDGSGGALRWRRAAGWRPGPCPQLRMCLLPPHCAFPVLLLRKALPE